VSDWVFGDIQPFSAGFLSIDPPWAYELYSEAGNAKAASAQYETMALEAIMALPIGHLASDNCGVALWTCSWMRPSFREACLEAWGATYKTEIAWRKTTKNGKVRMGVGYRARSMHETIYYGVIGNPQHKAFPSLFDGLAREHSRKPERWYELVNERFPNVVKIDVFSRASRPGWISWGREATKFDAGSPVENRERNAPQQEPAAPMPLFPNAA
jgi:N6-adenosine-specific RNA methylase IME4